MLAQHPAGPRSGRASAPIVRGAPATWPQQIKTRGQRSEASKRSANAWDRTHPACFKLPETQESITHLGLGMAIGTIAYGDWSWLGCRLCSLKHAGCVRSQAVSVFYPASSY